MDGLIGVILAGGASRRMGTDKALVEVAGAPMISWVVQALEQVVADVVISGREGELMGHPGVPDRYPAHSGPLGGLATVLDTVKPAQSLVVVAVDHPFVRAETLHGLVARFDGSQAVVPVAQGVRQVTVAVYPGSLAGAAQATMEGGGSMQSLLDEAGVDEILESEWRSWGEDGRSWFSADTGDAATAGLEAYGLPAR